MDVNIIRTLAAKITYPGNQSYDPFTFQPINDVTRKRIDHIKEHIPELLEGGDSLLDIGSSKGFVCFHLKDKYRFIVGYEPSKEPFMLSSGTTKYHGLDHIHFIRGSFRDITFRPILNSKFRGTIDDIYYDLPEKYTVVYAGSCHHNFYRDAINYGAPPFLWCKKLVGLCEKYLIIDGPFNPDDWSWRKFASDGRWSEIDRKMCSLENIEMNLKPQFALVRFVPNNERNRSTAVFKRVAPDMKYIDVKDIQELIKDAKNVDANKAREKDSVMRFSDGTRYKQDIRIQPDSVFLILNALPQYFPETKSVVWDNSLKVPKKVGDVTDWFEGQRLKSYNELRPYWTEINRALSAVGLIEIHFKPDDFKKVHKTVKDCDVDMLQSSFHLKLINQPYLDKWAREHTKVDKKAEVFYNTVAKDMHKIDLFSSLEKELCEK